jgi:hypothetical protein
MSPDVLFHSVKTATGKGGTREQLKVARTNTDRSEATLFAKRFKGDDDEEPELAEYGHGVPQVLWLMNGGQFDGGPALTAAQKLSPSAAIDQLYLGTFSRMPTTAERQRMLNFIGRDRDQSKGIAQAFWAMLNSSEFLFNH